MPISWHKRSKTQHFINYLRTSYSPYSSHGSQRWWQKWHFWELVAITIILSSSKPLTSCTGLSQVEHFTHFQCKRIVATFKPRSESGFQVAISKFQVPNQEPGQGFQLQFPSFKFQTKIQFNVSSCNCQVSRFKPRSRSGFQVAVSKFQVSNQDPGQGLQLQFPSCKFQTKIQVIVSSCNFQVSRFGPRPRSGFQVAIS